MNRKLFQQIICVGLVPLLLSGCNATGIASTAATPTATIQSAPTATNQPEPIATIQAMPTATIQLEPTIEAAETQTASFGTDIAGRFIVDVDFDIYQLTINSLTKDVEQTLIAADGLFATISPDKSYLLYLSYPDNEARLRDLRTGETRTVIKDPNISCLSWSPTSTKFSAVASNNLNTYDLSGNVTHIPYEPPSANYAFNGYGPGSIYYGSFDCGVWTSPDQLVFQRASVMTTNLNDAILNTTTLAALGDNPTVVDSPMNTRWYVQDVCKDKNLVILADEYSDMFLAHPFQDFENMKLRALDTGIFGEAKNMGRGTIGFIPGSDCEIYYQNPAIGFNPGVIHLMSSDTLEESSAFTVEETMYITSWGGIWVGSPQDRLIAIVESSGYSSDGHYISIVNLNTGTKTQLTKVTECCEMHILSWLP